MKSITLFGRYLGESYQVFTKDFSHYLMSFIAFSLVGLLASIPWEALGLEANSFYEVLVAILVGIINLIIIVNVILIEKGKYKHCQKEALVYAAPTYLIYTLYLSLIMLVGFSFVFPGFFLGGLLKSTLGVFGNIIGIGLGSIPGILLGVCFGMAPLASVLIDNDGINYFRVSLRMAKKDAILIAAFGLASLLTELPSFLFDMVTGWETKLALNVVYAFVSAVIVTILTMASVRVFFHLKQLLNDPS